MKTLYIECNMGAAGDMLMSALLELHPAPEDFINRLNHIGIPNVEVKVQPSVKCGIVGTHVAVFVDGQEEISADHNHSHHHHEHQHKEHSHDHHHEHQHKEHSHNHSHIHTGMTEVEAIISNLEVPQKVKDDVAAVYKLIAQAEGAAHGKPVNEIHFHEVGTMDAITDVVGVCWLLYELSPSQILASPVHVGSGQVQCAHGILPVPAPATAYILQGVPTYGGNVKGELCTPTGAALLKHFVSRYGSSPVMCVEKTGYGMGNKDFDAANCVRVMMGETVEPEQSMSMSDNVNQGEGTGNVDNDSMMDTIVELSCNLDDMTPEEIGFATGELIEHGALEVYTTSAQMKKNRPGIVLCCLCKPDEKERLIKLIFQCTSTLGIREYVCSRYVLRREEKITQTPYGEVHVKCSKGYGVKREKIEYEDLARIAREKNLSIAQVRQQIKE